MISFKIIINKIITENNKIKLYNSIIYENLKHIKDLFELNNLRVSIHKEKDNSITLQIDNGWEGCWFKYTSISEKDKLFTKKCIEKSLKDFIAKQTKSWNIQKYNTNAF